MGFDDRLATELERAARPADPSGLYEHMIRRRERRRIARKARTVVLTAAVVAGSIAGALGLWNVFGQRALVEPAGTTPTMQPSTEGQLPRGAEDVGIDFPICQVERIGKIDFLGDGTDGNAWTGTALQKSQTCREAMRHQRSNVLAVDHTGDQIADSSLALPFDCTAVCPPFAATDLDGNGTDELIVADYFSIMDFYVFAVRPDETGDLRVAMLLVAPPGHKPAGIEAGEWLRIDAGGDEGYTSSIRCEDYPSDPVIVWSWGYSPIDGAGLGELHVTRLELRSDGMFHVVETNDSTLPAGAQPEIMSQRELGLQCGVDWQL